MLYDIDPLHSIIEFTVRHLNISLVKGRFSDAHGTIDLDPQYPERSSVHAWVNADSIYTGSTRRDAHLRSADFFDVARFPTMEFQSNDFRLLDRSHGLLSGNLLMHGVTQPVTFQVTYTGISRDPLTNAWRIGLQAVTTVDRRNFKISFSQFLNEGIALIGNETRIQINLEAIQIL